MKSYTSRFGCCVGCRTIEQTITYVATQWAAVTIHLSFNSAPPQASFLDKNPVLIRATCQGCDANPVECPPTILLLLVWSSPQPAINLRMRQVKRITASANQLYQTCLKLESRREESAEEIVQRSLCTIKIVSCATVRSGEDASYRRSKVVRHWTVVEYNVKRRRQ